MNDEAMVRNMYAVHDDGRMSQASLRIDCLTIGPNNDWCATLSFAPLQSHRLKFYGLDSWQAMQICMKQAAVIVANFNKLGWRFYFDADRQDEISASSLLPSL